MKPSKLTAAIIISLAILSACTPSGVREKLGLEKGSPDEFAVIRRAPLEINDQILAAPKATLPAPRQGAARPQETSPEDKAREALLGQGSLQTRDAATASDADNLFLQRAGANNIDPDIRSEIDTETNKLHNRNKPVAERLFGFRGDKHNPSATVVNAKEEQERIRQNQEQGRAVTDGETPSIEE